MSRVLTLTCVIPLMCLALLASAIAQPPPRTSAEPSAAVPAAPPARPPADQSPNAQSPIAQSPIAQSPTSQSPTAQSPTAQSPASQSTPAAIPAAPPAQSPTDQSPPGQSPPAVVPATPHVMPAEQVAPAELTGLVGEVIQGTGGNEIGHIVNLLADGQGHVRAVVVDVGGFMGVGNRKVALAWSALHFDMGDKGPVVSTAIPLDRIRSWADYIPGRPIAILGAPGGTP